MHNKILRIIIVPVFFSIIIASLTPNLDWEDYANATGYRVQVSLDANINGIIIIDSLINTSNFSIPQGKLSTGINFYWRVIAILQGGGFSNWSAIWRFLIKLDPPPPPVLVAPANGSINVHFLPSFDWNESQTADFYRIQVSNSPAFIQLLIDSNRIPVTEYQCIPGFLITGTQYFWRVNASNSNGLSTSAWSTVFNFTTVQGPIPSSISGRVTFADTNFFEPQAYYVVGAYSSWSQFNFYPDKYDQIVIQQQGNTYYADYQITDLENISYRIAAGVLEVNSNYILGIYGCDTVHLNFSNCPVNPDSVTIQNYYGIDNINFLSWADTTKRIY